MMRKYQVRFGGGPGEKYAPDGAQLACGLPNLHRGGTESEATAERDGLGTASMAQWSGRFHRSDVADLSFAHVKHDPWWPLEAFTGQHRRFLTINRVAGSSATDFFTGQSAYEIFDAHTGNSLITIA